MFGRNSKQLTRRLLLDVLWRNVQCSRIIFWMIRSTPLVVHDLVWLKERQLLVRPDFVQVVDQHQRFFLFNKTAIEISFLSSGSFLGDFRCDSWRVVFGDGTLRDWFWGRVDLHLVVVCVFAVFLVRIDEPALLRRLCECFIVAVILSVTFA